ncbi:hypothetical protein DTO166G4_9161 [Paecilomyces variotii]|nr:hypothetical protein DTO166G4_9161 [Paecilomyces variotii]KAJ9220525.1 hypothetical protein DTO169C6_7153 [Paecilomyces variotii]KAJ9228203.1 hypothetical protein DTO166G5_8753 [Paecilomyces variotii]KAJ9350068.1 hypothetical protein DTO027B9_7209 [Paecilomyces variotii]
MPPHPLNKPHTTVPQNHLIFDPWNTASTGHQRAENPYSNTSEWRTTRTEKLSHQFGKPITNGSGDGTLNNGCRVSSKNQNKIRNGAAGEWRWISADEAERRRLGCADIRTLMGGGGSGGAKRRKWDGDENGTLNEKTVKKTKVVELRAAESSPSSAPSSTSQHSSRDQADLQHKGYAALPPPSARPKLAFCNDNPSDTNGTPELEPTTETPTGIFTGTTIYINGSTFPLISDHKLKHLLASNGAKIAITLARQTVTHVILGKPNGNGSGAGGGLAAGKLQKELQRSGSAAGRNVKFVGVEWVLESIKASKRLPECGFSNMNMCPKGQQSVLNMFKKKTGP